MSTLSLNFTNNMFGNLKPEYIKKIENYLKHPLACNWNEICCIIISEKPGFGRTIWQAVIEIDSTLPRKGRTTDAEGNILREWESVPTPEQVIKAIQKAAYSLIQNN